jgi:hypothetical protein
MVVVAEFVVICIFAIAKKLRISGLRKTSMYKYKMVIFQ